MEPESLELLSGVKAIAVLTAMSLVLFALWAESLEKPLQELLIQNPEFDRNQEYEKVRMASFCVVLFQFALFLGSSDVRQAFPMATEIIFTLGVLLQLGLQTYAENKVPPLSKTAEKEEISFSRFIMRVVVSWVIGAGVYIFSLSISVKFFSWIAIQAQMSPQAGMATLLLGGAIGAVLGLFINFAMGPFHLKKILPTSPLTDPELSMLLTTSFDKSGEKTGLKSPELLVVEIEQFQIGSTILSGFRKGRGAFAPTLFISRLAMKTLNAQEIRAMAMTQLSHIILAHFKKRFLLSLGLIIGTTVIAISSVIMTQGFSTDYAILNILCPATALFSFYISFKILSFQNRKHEFEADLYTLENLNVDLKDFSSALRKWEPEYFNPSTHPNPIYIENEKRIKKLEMVLALSAQDNPQSTDLKKAS